MQIQSEKNKRSYAKIVAMAWSSDTFKAALLRDPAKVIREHGMDLPEGTTVSVRDGGAGLVTQDGDAHPRLDLTLPPRPDDLADAPIMSRTSSAYFCSAGPVAQDEDARPRLELKLPPRPSDLVDAPIMTRTSSAYMCSAGPAA